MAKYVCGAYRTNRGIIVPKTPERDSIVKARMDAYKICMSANHLRNIPIHKIENGDFVKIVGEVYSTGGDRIEWRIPHPMKHRLSLGIWILNKDGTLGQKFKLR